MVMIRLDPWQKKFLQTEGDKILCTGRQVGKSVVCSIDAAEYSTKNKNKKVLMIAPTERQAYALFSKTLEYISMQHSKLLVKHGRDRPTKKRMKLRNGSEIWCLPVGLQGLGIRFITVDRLYIDEASRVPEEVFAAITPALLTTGGNTIMLSTPAGATGTFWKCFTNQDDAWESFTRFSTSSEQVIRDRQICSTWRKEQRDAALQTLEQEKKRMPAREYAQEYLGEFIEEFNRVFPDALIKKCCILKRRDRVYPHRRYYMGVDIARMGDDECTFEILDKINKDSILHVESIVKRKQYTTDTEDNIVHLQDKYRCRGIGIDAGAGTLGVSVLDHLLRIDSTKNKVIALNNRALSLDTEGKNKQRLLKEDMYNNLLALMEQGRIKLLDDDEVVASLRSVMYEYVMNVGRPTRVRIFGNYTHIAEGLIRAAWLATEDKSLKLWCYY